MKRDSDHHALIENIITALHRMCSEDTSYQYTFARIAVHCIQELGVTPNLVAKEQGKKFKVTKAAFEGIVKTEIIKFTPSRSEQKMLLGQILIRLVEPLRGRLLHEYLFEELSSKAKGK